MKRYFGLWLLVLALCGWARVAKAAEWQWAVPSGEGRGYLWIPPSCSRVRAVVVANHNMIEQGILEHPAMRRTLSNLGFAEVWIVPGMDIKFDFHNGADAAFQRIMDALATESGYDELRLAPVVALGHSANATWPWNFAAWNPSRTLAILSVHGDAPQTTLTGYGGANVDWGDRDIDGVPALMVMGEYEWNEDRLAPALKFRGAHPNAPIAFLADAGHGHFDYSDELVAYLAMFIRKAARARLPRTPGGALYPVDPRKGWLIDRWRKDAPPLAPSAPYKKFRGVPGQDFWAFDREMALATERYYAAARGKKPQLLSVTDGQTPPEKGVGEPVTPRLIPMRDGVTFRLQISWADIVPPNNGKATFWTSLPAGTRIGHPTGGGPIALSKIVGPIVQTGPNTFKIALGRAESMPNRRNNDAWIWAHHSGDNAYKSMVQQALVRLTPNSSGVEQHITFPILGDQKVGLKTLQMSASSDAGLPVSYFVICGPVEVEGNVLRFTRIPPRAKLPLKVTVVAWQWGRGVEPMVKTASPVEQTFFLRK